MNGYLNLEGDIFTISTSIQTVLSKNVSDTLSRQTVTWKNETFCLWVCCHLVTERKHKVKESNCLLHLVSCEMELSWCSPWIHCGRRIHSHWEQMSKEPWFFSSGWTAAQAGSLVETEEDTYHYHYKKILPLWFYSYQRCELESKSSDLTETWKVNLWFDLTWDMMTQITCLRSFFGFQFKYQIQLHIIKMFNIVRVDISSWRRHLKNK